MPLRRLLTSLGLRGGAAAPDADPFLRRLQEQLARLGADRLEYLAAFAGQLARVAASEDGISAAEAAAMTAQLASQQRLGADHAALVVDLLTHELEALRALQPHLLTRTLNAQATPEEKQVLLDSLYAVAAADHLVSLVEEQEIRRIAGALLVPHSVLMSIRARYRDRLEILQGGPRPPG